MRRAIALSAFGLGTTSPNPPVGCVILDAGGTVVGEGYHQRKGEPHAEGYALAVAGERARGGTAIVTLEPCNHVGRTPACRQLLIDAGIARVIIALPDPTSRDGGSVARLRACGIQVECDVLSHEAALVLGPWLAATRTGRPWVTWVYAVHGGRIISVGRSGIDQFAPEVAGHMAGPRQTADAVVYDDGHLEEGTPGGHGANVLALPATVSIDKPENLLTALYEGGVRSLLLFVDPATAAAFVSRRLIQEVAVYLEDGNGLAASFDEVAVMPPGFRVVAVARVGDSSVCVRGKWDDAL